MKKTIFSLTLLCSLQLHAQWRTIFKGTDTVNTVVSSNFYSPSNGFIATNKWIGYTADSGHSFQRRFVTTSNVNFGGNQVNLTFGFAPSDVKAFDNNRLLIGGNYGYEPSILYSQDGGQSWQLVFHRPLPGTNAASNSIYQMSFPAGGSTGFAVQNNEIIKTTNSGQSWQTVYSSSQGLFSIVFTSTTTGYAAGQNILLKTTNGGSSWSTVTGPFAIQAMTAVSDQHIYVFTLVGDCFSSVDGGATWHQANSQTGRLSVPQVGAIRFVNDSTGYLTANLIYQTRNSGKSWELMPSSYPAFDHVGWQNLFFYDSQQAWATGSAEALALTVNGGGTTIPRALFDVNTSELCNGNVVKLVNQGQPGYSYSWYRNKVLISTEYNASYVANAGNDTIKLVVSNGSVADSSIQMVAGSVRPILQLNSAPAQDTACSNATLRFTIYNSQPGVQYQVRRSCCSYSSYIPGNGQTFSIPYQPNAGEDSMSTFTVFAIRTDACGTDSASQTFRVKMQIPNPPTSVLTDTICAQGSFYIRIPNSRLGYKYWADPSQPVAGNGDTIYLPCTVSRASHSSSVSGDNLLTAYHFPIYVSSIGEGCGTVQIADALEIGRGVVAKFDISGYTWATGQTLAIINESLRADHYLWKSGDGNMSMLPTAAFSYASEGDKHLGLVAYSLEGCVDSIEKVVTIFNQTAVPATNICPAGPGNVVDSLTGQWYYVPRAVYEDEKGDRVEAGGFDSQNFPAGLEGWWAVKRDKSGKILWSLNQTQADAYHTFQRWPHVIIEQAAGDSSGSTYLLGHEFDQLNLGATGEMQVRIPSSMADFLIKVSPAGHIVWIKTLYSMSGSSPYDFTSCGSLLRGKGNTLYLVMQRYPGSSYAVGSQTVFQRGEGNEGIILQLDTAGNMLRKSTFLCPPVNLWNPFTGRVDNYWHTPPASFAGGNLVIYTTLYPAQTTLEQATIGFNSTQIPAALAVFDTTTLHAIKVLPVYSTVSGAAMGVSAESYAMDSTGAYYISYSTLVSKAAPNVPVVNNYDTLRAVTYIEAFTPSGNIRWTKLASGLAPKRMLVFPNQLKVCGTNFALSGWTYNGMNDQDPGPTDPSVKKPTLVGEVGSLSGRGGIGIGSLDIVVATLQTSDGQLLDFLPLGTTAEDENMIMSKGAGNQLWVASSVGGRWRNPAPANYALYTYKLPVTSDCYGGYPDQQPFLKWNTSSDTSSCIDSLYTLAWSSAGTNTVTIRYSKDNGLHYVILATAVPATNGIYTFNAVETNILGKLIFTISDDGSALTDTISRLLNRAALSSVAITASDSSVCNGSPVLFTATGTNGGTAPVYQWMVNHSAVGGNSDTLTLSTLKDQDVVQVQMKGNLTCSSTVSVSNSIIIGVSSMVTPVVFVNGNTVGPIGKADTLFAHTQNEGTSFTISWQDSTATHSWTPIGGAVDSVLTYVPSGNGDKLRCEIRVVGSCISANIALSNVLVFAITAPPADTTPVIPPTMPVTPPAIPVIPDSASAGTGNPHLYPNPVNAILLIDSLRSQDEWQRLDIFGNDGLLIISGVSLANQTSVSIPVANLPKGFYWVRLAGKNRKTYIRFLKL